MRSPLELEQAKWFVLIGCLLVTGAGVFSRAGFLLKTRRWRQSASWVQVQGKVVVALLGVALLAASPGGSRADDADAAAAFLTSLTDQAIEQLTDASSPTAAKGCHEQKSAGDRVKGCSWR